MNNINIILNTFLFKIYGVLCLLLVIATIFLSYLNPTNQRNKDISMFRKYINYTTLNNTNNQSTSSIVRVSTNLSSLTTNLYDENPLDDWMYKYYRAIEPKNVENVTEMKYILFWDTFFGDKTMSLGLGEGIFKNCPIKTCMTTNNRYYMAEEKFDAIIFHGARWNDNNSGHPTKRNTNQKYIFFSRESPYNCVFDTSFYKVNPKFYNWTLTYRRDSDIHAPYGIFKKQKTDYSLPIIQDLKKKTTVAMWLVSNCYSTGARKRQEYVEELKKYIQIDVFGKCGTHSCTDCRKLTETNYFFYLSFENSMCEDYVTEKVYDVMRYNVVPVVFGASNYRDIAPPHSVIDTKDFRSPRDLADYLVKVSENLTLYLEYLQWKKNYVLTNPREYVLCQLCEMLHKPISYSSYEDIIEWYFGFDKLKCY